jgi:hypothetical protein
MNLYVIDRLMILNYSVVSCSPPVGARAEKCVTWRSKLLAKRLGDGVGFQSHGPIISGPMAYGRGDDCLPPLVIQRVTVRSSKPQVPSRFVLELGDAISGILRVPSQAARSIV